MKMMNLNQVVTLVEEEQMLLFSQCCSDLYTKKPQGEKRVRRKRKKAKREGEGVGWKKRKLSDEQINFLEMNFGSEHKLQSARKYRLAAEIGLEPQQVAVWFQNRRARWKGKKIEEEYLRLKTINEGIVIEKCRLEAEVLKLGEELSEARKEIQKLSGSDGERSRSCSSSMNAYRPFLGEIEFEENENLLYTPEINYNIGMEWCDYMSPFIM
ncbi:homeobox-leucine zipper protein ATHB-21-like isoform X1 [Tasmannia lanceolata]|uniref:homeobox-leucine zipper protein ATHB-21-like isoform X1 n=1 Tax=Tasmannia lanceolata TaxID=3420 RepID=UPI0040642912